MTFARLRAVICIFVMVASGMCQGSGQTPRVIPGTDALNRALRASTLTFEGNPFHAVMEIGELGKAYSGRIELWWIGPKQYKLVIDSQTFRQVKVVHGDEMQEVDEGNYLPRWLDNFALALLNPEAVTINLRGASGNVWLGSPSSECLKRDDRPGGIIDQMTWGEVCFSGVEPRLAEVLTFNVDMSFSDWKPFAGRQIART